MRVLLALLIAVCVFAAIAADNPVRPTPLIRTVDPPVAKCGAELIATGDNLGKTAVESLYLTEGEATTKVEMVKQTDTTITFKIPEGLKAGRRGLMVLTTGIDAHYIDEPVSLTIE